MIGLDALSDVISVVTILTCWVLVHQNRFKAEPLSFYIALAWAVLSIMTAANFTIRHRPDLTEWLDISLLLSRLALVAAILLNVGRNFLVQERFGPPVDQK